MQSSPVPGLDGLLPASGPPAAQVVRTGSNQWLIGIGGPALGLGSGPATDPGVVAAEASVDGGGFVGRVELDACGAWVTMAGTADLQPLVVRRAGWVDERGDSVAERSRPWPEDRVGLGPGDAVVVVHRPSGTEADPEARAVDPVAECLLDHVGAGVEALVDAVEAVEALGPSGPSEREKRGPSGPSERERLGPSGPSERERLGPSGPSQREAGASRPRVVAALAVPGEVAGVGWVVEATGVAEADLVLPGYPLGDREPERWRQPPRAPRRATFRLHRDPARLRDLRGVLGRLVSSWRLQDRIDDSTLTLLTTELATNALVHTDTSATATITYLGPLVRVEVHDGSSRLPSRRTPTDDDVGGRGIALIDDLAAGWGTTATATGKRTWFELGVGPPAGAG